MTDILRRAAQALDKILGAVVGAGFGLKDLFTLVNLGGGVVSIWFAMQGRVEAASAAVMLGYLGDVLDGPVARFTRRQNKFGSELDSIADHMAQCIAPAFVVLVALAPLGRMVSLALAFIVVTTGSIRHARAAAVKFEFDLCWNGMPRPVAAFLVLAYLNSHLRGLLPFGDWVGAGLVLLVSVLNLVSLPFVSHHGRPLQPVVKAAVVAGFVLGIGAGLLYPSLFWDLLLFMITLYSLSSWVTMTQEERRHFFDAARRWRSKLADRSVSGESA